jgi:Na+-translocating ferredoxin:NAD+ oxidoreductase subunit B
MNSSPDETYRLLQRHLDHQAVGFPAVRSDADIKLLQFLFTPDEAKVALQLSYHPQPQDAVITAAVENFPAETAVSLLESSFQKGAIGWKLRDGVSHWYLLPLYVGIFEAQDGNPSREFLAAAGPYMKSLGYVKSLLAVAPSQMRTIPINKSVSVNHSVATYDQVRSLVKNSKGPFVVFNCTCRVMKKMQGHACKQTGRLETCLGMGDMAAMLLRRNHGREITAEEAIALVQQNEEDGLVLQPANERNPEFICSCCGCCCSMLQLQKRLPYPLEYWTTNYYAKVNADACVQCGACVKRCQVGALSLDGPDGKAAIEAKRCIGCGLCVSACPKKAITLFKKEAETVPPEDREKLLETIAKNKPGRIGQWGRVAKVALRIR